MDTRSRPIKTTGPSGRISATRVRNQDRHSVLAHTVSRAFEQVRRDLIALRLFDLDTGDGWTVSAGLPHYLALFGLTAAWQAALIGPEMMRALWRDWRNCRPVGRTIGAIVGRANLSTRTQGPSPC